MSLFSDLKPKAHLSRNVFDNSHSETFSTKLGTLTPVFIKHTVPDGKYKINISDLVYPSTMQKANFSAITQNVEFAFIPYSQLWNRFNKFYFGRGENMHSENVSQGIPVQPAYCPQVALYEVVRDLINICVRWEWFDGVRRYNETLANPNDLSDLWSWAESIGLLLPSGVDWHTTRYIDVHGRFCGYDQLRVIDMLGYGNFIPVINYLIYEAETAGTMDFTINPTAANIAVVDAALDADFSSYVDSKVPAATVLVNAFPLMAYVKFFNDYYKNREYDTYDYSYLFNCDWYVGNSYTSVYSPLNICNMIKPYYRQYKRDLFTGSYPNPQFGNVAVAGLENPSTLYLPSSPTATNYGNVRARKETGEIYVNYSTGNDYGITIESSVSALAVRQAEALQRWKERIMRAGNRIQDLNQAIFGVNSKYVQDEYVDFLGSFASSVNINPVAATAETGSLANGDLTNVGDLGASSVGSINMGEQKEIEFDSYDFGIIIGLMYFLPDAKYEAFGLDPHNVASVPEQFYRPDMQNLGLESVPSYIAAIQGQFDITGATNLGFLSRYWKYKTSVSRVHGEFYGSSLVMPTSESGRYQNLPLPASFGAFSDYVQTRNAYDIAAGDLRMLYVAPWDSDRLFVVSDRPSPKFDHFIVEMTFRCKEVLPMSVQGLPLSIY